MSEFAISQEFNEIDRNFPLRFTEFIRPACLWQTASVNTTKTIASGWGYTEALGQTSNDLMKVELDLISNRQCNGLLEDAKLDNGIIDSQMCAGVLTGGKDTCNGGELEAATAFLPQ